jgi:tRNA threonylcarbamoyladenosine biosynthesis protein TsaB
MKDIHNNNAAPTGLYLAIDTSTSSLSVAVLDNGHLLGELTTYADKNHSIGLLPNIQELLRSLGLKPKDLQAVAVGKGPGSYTGVRIGVSVAKTFAWSLGIDLIGVSSLEAMALGGRRRLVGEAMVEGLVKSEAQRPSADLSNEADATKWIIPLMDARRTQAFTALYEDRGSWISHDYFVKESAPAAAEDQGWHTRISDGIRLMAPWLEEITALAKDAQRKPEQIVFVGETEGFAALLFQFAEHWQQGTVQVIPMLLNAQDVGLLAYPHWIKGELAELHTFVPNYAQLPEAEVKLREKMQKGEQ